MWLLSLDICFAEISKEEVSGVQRNLTALVLPNVTFHIQDGAREYFNK